VTYKLSFKEIEEIRNLRKNGISAIKLAIQYGVTDAYIRRLVSNKSRPSDTQPYKIPMEDVILMRELKKVGLNAVQISEKFEISSAHTRKLIRGGTRLNR